MIVRLRASSDPTSFAVTRDPYRLMTIEIRLRWSPATSRYASGCPTALPSDRFREINT